jgi:hypothetical protein
MTNPEPPRRYKSYGELTVAEIVERQARLAQGELDPKIESEEYRQHRREALLAGGLDEEASEDETPLEEQSVEQHVWRMQRR